MDSIAAEWIAALHVRRKWKSWNCRPLSTPSAFHQTQFLRHLLGPAPCQARSFHISLPGDDRYVPHFKALRWRYEQLGVDVRQFADSRGR